MARPIVMPSLGMYTAEGTLVQWLQPAGTAVSAGTAVALVETEKATYELEAAIAGVLHPTAVVGAVLPVEAVLGYLLAEGEAPPGGAPAAAAAPLPASRPAAADTTQSLPGGLRASPIAKRLAREHGVDLAKLRGSGPGGRIVEADVVVAIAEEPRGTAPSQSPTPASAATGLRIPLSGMRGTIADRLRHSLMTAASLTLTSEARAEALIMARRWLRTPDGTTMPYDALLIKLFAMALRRHPELNATVEGRTIVRLEEIHIGFAVTLPEGLIVPVVRNADRRPLEHIAIEVRDLSKRARAGTLRPAEVIGGTASISNLGAYGIDAFTPILNPPQAVILGIGRIASRPVVEDDKVVPGKTCTLSLTFDHRVTDGAPAALLLAAVAQGLADERSLHAALRPATIAAAD